MSCFQPLLASYAPSPSCHKEQGILAKKKLNMVLPRFEPMTIPMPTQYITI